jgi:hypothetical protein
MWFMWLWMVFLVSDNLCRFLDFVCWMRWMKVGKGVMDDNDVSFFVMAEQDLCENGSVANSHSFSIDVLKCISFSKRDL